MAEATYRIDIDAAETGLDALAGVRELLYDIANGRRQFETTDPDHLATLLRVVSDHIARAIQRPT